MRNATGRREVAGGVIRNLHRMHIAYQHAVPGLGKSEGEELVTGNCFDAQLEVFQQHRIPPHNALDGGIGSGQGAARDRGFGSSWNRREVCVGSNLKDHPVQHPAIGRNAFQ